jgi:ATP phosphoribosyltransferase regulatory subunit
MFKFQDFDGKLLALRAEMTAPVARIVTTRMPSTPEPIRLFYITNVFRYNQSYLKNEREFYQAGVELVGCNTPEADAEILALLISILKKIGLKDVRIDLSHANLLKNLLNMAKLNQNQKTSIKNILACRDSAGLTKFMEKNNFQSNLREIFLQLSCCRKLNEISSISIKDFEYDEINKQLETLTRLQETLDDYEISEYVYFDFSLTKQIEYYTGMVFEASVPNLGLPLGSGGRYDKFIKKFGKIDLPATGFALELGKIIQALTTQGFEMPKDPRIKIIVTSNFFKTAIKAVESLRKIGIITSLEVSKRNLEKTIEFGKLSKNDYVIKVYSSLKKPITIFDLESQVSRTLIFSTFLKDLEG